MNMALVNFTQSANMQLPFNHHAYIVPEQSFISKSVYKRHLHNPHRVDRDKHKDTSDSLDDTEGSGYSLDDTELEEEDGDVDFIFDESKSDSALDDPDKMPFDVDYVMTSIDPFNSSLFNATGNFTQEPRPRWKNILDDVVKYIMMFNVIGLMTGMGCAIYWRDIVAHLWPPIGILIGMMGQFLVLPATAFGYSILFKLTPYEALGCLVVSCSPGGAFSNFFTYWMDGDLALSVVMTAFSSIIAFGGMPFNLWMYSSYYVGDTDMIIPFLSIIRSLAFICFPVVLGMVIRHFSEKIARIITRVTTTVGYVCFITVLASWVILYHKLFVQATPFIYAGAVLLPITGISLAYFVAFILKRPHKVCRTIGIETGSQNMPVALSIILLTFDDPEIRSQMIVFPTMYGLFMFAEFFIALGIFLSIKFCMNYKKKKQEPPGSASTVENGTKEETKRLNN